MTSLPKTIKMVKSKVINVCIKGYRNNQSTFSNVVYKNTHMHLTSKIKMLAHFMEESMDFYWICHFESGQNTVKPQNGIPPDIYSVAFWPSYLSP